MKYAFIPAAGNSTRLKELGKQYAKTVLPYLGEPIVEHIIRNLLEAGPLDYIIIAVANELHLSQINRAIASVEGNCKIRVVQFDDLAGEMNPGPAKTIIKGLKTFEQIAGITFTKHDSLVVHLSDSLFAVADIASMPLDSIGYGIVNDYSRWCMVSDEILFYDKPIAKPPTDKAVSGLYKFSNIYDLLDFDCVNSGESQISEILKQYNLKHPISLHLAPILKDFGTLEDYILNRGVAKSRSFNEIIELGNRTILKTSKNNPEKVISEGLFMLHQPPELSHFYPTIINVDTWQGTVEMDKIRSTNLRDLYLYMDRSEATWSEVFSGVEEFMKVCKSEKANGNFWGGIIDKTKSRILDRYRTNDVNMFLDKFETSLQEYEDFYKVTRFHGDLHFANMFYCFTYKDLKLIDPKGDFRGHWLYDTAKLNHSVAGKYDWIDAELYTNNCTYDLGTDGVVFAFNKFKDAIGMSAKENNILHTITASLFLSMIPLHSHSIKNQDMFYEEFIRFSLL